jgi:hypothetical protein
MERCWTLEPTSERIIVDIVDFLRELQIVIDHKGAVVPEINLRHGHRLQATNNGRVLKRKVSTRPRKHLLKLGPIHLDAQDALAALLRTGRTSTLHLKTLEMLLPRSMLLSMKSLMPFRTMMMVRRARKAQVWWIK